VESTRRECFGRLSPFVRSWSAFSNISAVLRKEVVNVPGEFRVGVGFHRIVLPYSGSFWDKYAICFLVKDRNFLRQILYLASPSLRPASLHSFQQETTQGIGSFLSAGASGSMNTFGFFPSGYARFILISDSPRSSKGENFVLLAGQPINFT